jgi:pyruvate/2-oxoglutarate/acetoin dehydrogenase E1 component
MNMNYGQAIREAHALLLRQDPKVFLIGQGVKSPWYAGSSLHELDKEFGDKRIIDTPVSENATTGAAIGAAISGMRPIVFHPRMDFMLLAVDPIINQASNWSYIFAGEVNVPIVIRAVINRGGEQGAQHSQALHAMFMHIPGLKVVMPSTPYDAKGLLISAVNDGNPVIYIDDRWLYDIEDEVPEECYEVEIGKGVIRKKGKDVTIIGISYMAKQAVKASETLSLYGIDAEIIDLRSLKPWDEELVLASVRKTGRCVIADPGWITGGASAEIAAVVGNKLFGCLKDPILRISLPDAPAPVSKTEEDVYYRTSEDIVNAVLKIIKPQV